MTKKINDMNYEEKYKKAVQQIRDLLERSKENGWLQMLAFEKDFEQIFPELAESEDERIRKEIIAFLKENLETGGRADETWSISGLERWIAWLEKQGLQNLANSAKTCKDEEDWSEEDELLHNQKE